MGDQASNANPTGRVTVVRSLNMDLVARAPRLPKPGETLAGHAFAQVPGGKGGNQAVAAARLGAQVAMIGCIGDDSNGGILKAALEHEGIDCAALIVVDDASQNAIVIVAGSNAEVSPASIDAQDALIACADVIVCQLETPPQTVRAALAAGRRLQRTTILNPAPAATKLPVDWFPLIDYLIPNEIEAATLSGVPIATVDDARRAAEMLKAKGARNVIVTLGAQGVFALLDGAGGKHMPAPKSNAIDTAAAGDTFIGGFAAELARGAAVTDAIAFGQRAAAIAVTREGAQPFIPHRGEVAV
ncbi:Ribokinase [Candidatus Burkholderia verschuerenii]|uniref:Ribokinase n=1 Tax=Candidatus Burkholderia verschuerenii TaxID=242163 RepID=A0A0L0MFU9_9BURK|nr:ribokinase [Candidatus Burkholderia verschuerenii]KND61150.1 Ribokinase [Candidatus Burkholderia verschuerenii]